MYVCECVCVCIYTYIYTHTYIHILHNYLRDHNIFILKLLIGHYPHYVRIEICTQRARIHVPLVLQTR